MRITKIVVKKLFGMFDHEIPLKMEDKITIIHGPNGLGKTVLLTMLNSLFKNKFSFFRKIPFNEFIVEFDDKRKLSLSRELRLFELKSNRSVELTLELFGNGNKPKTFKIKLLDKIKKRFPFHMIEDILPDVQRIGRDTWIYLPTQETLTFTDIIERYGDLLPIEGDMIVSEPNWFKEIRNNLNIHFIETQRLLSYGKSKSRIDFDSERPMIPAVKNYSEELVSSIQQIFAEYGSLSQSLDRTFPTRLVKGMILKRRSVEELRNELNQLEEKRSQLMTAGLLDMEQEFELSEFLNIDSSNQDVLSVYIEDVKKKLGVFDDLTEKIDLLINIVNSRFLYKRMSISKKEGFQFKGINDKDVPAMNLSSGEQHELVLFYELLFKVKPNSLILIDEPELSLHVIWQQQFLNDMKEIIKLSKFDLLIATHSPSIIRDRWDLTTELTGPEDEKPSNSD